MPNPRLSLIQCSTAFLLLLALTTNPLFAQDSGAAELILPTEETLQNTDGEPSESAMQGANDSSLDQCISDKSQLVGTLVQLQQESRSLLTACETGAATSILNLEEQLTICKENDRLNQRTNIGLNDALETCRTAPPPEDTVSSEALELAETQIEALRNQLSALGDYSEGVQTKLEIAEASVAQLEARLEELDVNLVPEFSYFGSDPFEGFVRASDISSLIGPDGTLEASQCTDALAWLATQSGSNRPLRLVLWVIREGEFELCQDGSEGPTKSTPTDEAHLVLFQ